MQQLGRSRPRVSRWRASLRSFVSRGGIGASTSPGAFPQFKSQVEAHVVPEAFTALSKALDAAEAKGGPIRFSDEAGMARLADELAKTGVWESLGVNPGGSLMSQYEAEEVKLCSARLKVRLRSVF